MTLKLRLVLAILTVNSLPGWAQSGSDLYAYPRTYKDFSSLKQDLRQLTFSRLPGISTDYRIGPGDVVGIEVVGLPALSPTLTVSNAGLINIPLLGMMPAADLTAAELEGRIAEQLKQKQLLLEPEVLVDVVTYVAKPIFILGEIDKAGEYVMSQQWTLMDAILVAGGIDDSAGQYGYLHRRLQPEDDTPLVSTTAPADPRDRTLFNTLRPTSRMPQVDIDKPGVAAPGTEVIRVDLTAAKKGGVVEPNILMRKGDVFIVPRRNAEVFYVIGDVKRAGPIPIRSDESLLVTQAIAESGGPNATAKLSEGILVRHDASGNRVERPIDFSAILHGKKPDFNVLPDDIIFIPGSSMKTLGMGLLGTIPSTVQQGVTIPKR